MRKIAILLLRNSPGWLAEIREGVSRGDASQLARAVHKLAGAVSSFVAPEVSDAARKLEALSNSGDLTDAADVFASLEENMTRLVSALADVVARGDCKISERGPVCAPLGPEMSSPCIR
jgi:HPt (histidine-containing phosphotransfer) domain-containing protein